MKQFVRPRPIQSPIGYFLAAAFVSRFIAVVAVYPVAEMVLSPSVSLNEMPSVSLITSALHGFLFSWTSFWFLQDGKPGRSTNILLIVLALIFFTTVDSVTEQIKASGQIQYGSPEADALVLKYAGISVLVFLLPYLLGRAIFAPIYKKWRESTDAF